jgi:hypothetical protein
MPQMLQGIRQLIFHRAFRNIQLLRYLSDAQVLLSAKQGEMKKMPWIKIYPFTPKNPFMVHNL